MAKIQIRCLHCGHWFNSPVAIGDGQTFDTAMFTGNKVQCPSCGKMTDCNKENMKANFSDGGFVGDETV